MSDALRARLTHWRVRLAHAVLLPDLSGAPGTKLRKTVEQEGQLTTGYVLMCALSAGIATLGLLQSSIAVVIGAMLISPLMAPIAALGFGFSSLDPRRIKEAARVVAVGAGIGIVTGVLLTWLSPIRNATPEIIARTEPTLLDLAIALLSGVAGGYATVQQKGGTAIGVAIATALMPPLATVGYGLGVLRIGFAGGALLLFLTNLAAIAFSFALIARLSGAARPLRNVELTPRHILAGMLAFAALALPLGSTLLRVRHENEARSIARELIKSELKVADSGIAQLDATWSLFGEPRVDAVVISPAYRGDAQAELGRKLSERLGQTTALNLQQVVAADVRSQTRAMIDAAMERTVAGIVSDTPPYAEIQAAIALPVEAIWVDRAQHVVFVRPLAPDGWELADFRQLEGLAAKQAGGWSVRIVPPATARLLVVAPGADRPQGAVPIGLAVWAIERWGLQRVAVASGPAEEGKPSPLETALEAASIKTVAGTANGVQLRPGQYQVSFPAVKPDERDPAE